MRKIVVLDGYTTNPGDLSWKSFEDFGTVKVYDRTEKEDVLQRLEGAQIAFTNKAFDYQGNINTPASFEISRGIVDRIQHN